MGKLLKAGRVVVVLNGRMAGKKAVVLNSSEGTRERSFSHCLIAGVEKAPLKVTKRMGKKKVEKRSRVKPFVRYVNVNHLMPTRHTVGADIDLKALQADVTDEKMSTSEGRKGAKKMLKGVFYTAFTEPTDKSGKKFSRDVAFLRKKLRF